MSDDPTMGEIIADALVAGLPRKDYVIVSDERSLDAFDKKTIVVSQQGFIPSVEAPMSHITIKFTLRIISVLQDMVAADRELTDSVTDVCFLIDKLRNVTWKTADKLTHENRYLAYDVSVEATAKRKRTP